MKQHSNIPISSADRNLVLNLRRDIRANPSERPRFNALLGGIFGSGIKTFCQKHNIALMSIDFVGTHTAALRHLRPLESATPNKHLLDWSTTVTAETGITSVADFAVFESVTTRTPIPLVAFVDRLFLRHPTKFRACLSIGELANLSFIPPLVDGNAHGTQARDCGPGSLLIDYAMRYHTSNGHSEDSDGTYAASGSVDSVIVDRHLFSHDYLVALPPLTIAQEMFGDHEAQQLVDECLYQGLSPEDTLATITRITAKNIMKQYRRLLAFYFPRGQQVDELFISGPSARNSNIIDYLEAELPENVITKPFEDIYIPGDAKEAVCYAHLALEAVLGQATRPEASSSTPSLQPGDAVVQGRITYGANWEQTAALLVRFSEGKHLRVTKDVRAENLDTAISGLDLR